MTNSLTLLEDVLFQCISGGRCVLYELQGVYRSWKVMEIKIQIFQGLESHGIRPRSWKVLENKPNGCCCFLTHCNRFRPFYVCMSFITDLHVTQLKMRS